MLAVDSCQRIVIDEGSVLFLDLYNVRSSVALVICAVVVDINVDVSDIGIKLSCNTIIFSIQNGLAVRVENIILSLARSSIRSLNSYTLVEAVRRLCSCIDHHTKLDEDNTEHGKNCHRDDNLSEGHAFQRFLFHAFPSLLICVIVLSIPVCADNLIVVDIAICVIS